MAFTPSWPPPPVVVVVVVVVVMMMMMVVVVVVMMMMMTVVVVVVVGDGWKKLQVKKCSRKTSQVFDPEGVELSSSQNLQGQDAKKALRKCQTDWTPSISVCCQKSLFVVAYVLPTKGDQEGP